MKKIILTLIVLSIGLVSYAQVVISGVRLPAELNFEEKTLFLNGGGLRQKLWIDLYVGGLYLPERTNSSRRIIEADQVQAIRLQIVSRLITSEKMKKAIDEGMQKSTGGNTGPLADKIESFKSFFSIEEIVKGDLFDIVYFPDKGVVVYKNEKLVGVVDGLRFKQALWGIWLGDEPADKDLKEGMLGL